MMNDRNREKFDPKKNFADLPAELIAELSLVADSDEKIIEIFKEGGGKLNVSEVLVGYYKLHNEIKKRPYIVSALYRMSKKGILINTERKGEYILNQVYDLI